MKHFILTLATLCGLLNFAQAAPQKLNILFCFADDWGRYARCYAAVDDKPSLNDVVQTPNIDRVAREGVLFRNAFVPAPSCTPCRSSLLSGRPFFGTGRGAILRGAVWDAAIPSFPLLLNDNGYFIGKTGKVWSPGTPADAPFGGQKYAFQKAGMEFSNFGENATKRVQNGLTIEAAKAELLGQVRGNFEAFLAARGTGKEAKPWCYWFGPTNVHREWEKGSGKRLWGIESDALKGKMPPQLPDVDEVRADVADGLGEVQAWDAMIGELLKTLEARGELERTAIVISGDHGMAGVPGGKCNLYDLGTRVALLARVPGVKTNNQANGRAARVVDDFVSLTDLAPTFMEIGGAPVPPGVSGRSLWPLLQSEKSGQIDATRDFVITGRERHVETAREGNLPYPQRALRTKDYLYIRNFAPERWPMGAPGGVTENAAPTANILEHQTYAAFADMDASPTKAWLIMHRSEAAWQPFYERAFAKRPAEELFDLRADPDQMKNVAGEARYAAAKNELSARLMKVLTQNGDPRVTGDGSVFDKPPFAGVAAND